MKSYCNIRSIANWFPLRKLSNTHFTKNRTALKLSLIIAAGALLAACSSSSPSAAPHKIHKKTVSVKVIPAPKALLSAAPPQPDGSAWVLSGTSTAKTITDIDLSNGKTISAVGIDPNADSLAESSTGILVVGIATTKTGAVQLLNSSTGAMETTIPVGAPVKDLAFGSNGTTLYVLNGNTTSESITTIDTATKKVGNTFGTSLGTISISTDPSQSAIWGLGANGTVNEQGLPNGGVAITAFPTGNPGISITTSPTNGTVYVLKGTPAGSNIAVISPVTDAIETVLPAAAGSIALATSVNGRTLYDFVGTPSVGNIQEIALPPSGK